MTTQMVKMTVSVPQHLISIADEIATEQQVSRSKIVSACLEKLAKQRLRAEMEEGYKAMAEEHLQFANVAMDLAHEVVPDWE